MWLFINDTLRLDLGGLHPPIEGYVDVDEIASLKNYEEYTFDFFYCERHAHASHIWISTNMFVYVPQTVGKRHWKRDYGMLD